MNYEDGKLEQLSIVDQIAAERVFPITLGSNVSTFGLTKRELFAAMAMQGYLSSGTPGQHLIPPNLAREAVEQADALLKKLAK